MEVVTVFATALLGVFFIGSALQGYFTGLSVKRGGVPGYALRISLFVAGLAFASPGNVGLAVFYQRLRAAGKKPKVALIAVMRKLVVLANTLITQDRLWQPKPPIQA